MKEQRNELVMEAARSINKVDVIVSSIIFIFSNVCSYLAYAGIGNRPSFSVNIISKYRFFSQYFFPEINNIYWQKPKMKKQRNGLVMEALEDENLHKLVEANNCILYRSPISFPNQMPFARFCHHREKFYVF
jgi:hypothetical protein